MMIPFAEVLRQKDIRQVLKEELAEHAYLIDKISAGIPVYKNDAVTVLDILSQAARQEWSLSNVNVSLKEAQHGG
jgi:hypothetical protein